MKNRTSAPEIELLLRQAMETAEVRVDDDSARHAGHAGVAERGGGHYRVWVRWHGFAGLGRLARHRLVHAALAEVGGIHALELHLEDSQTA